MEVCGCWQWLTIVGNGFAGAFARTRRSPNKQLSCAATASLFEQEAAETDGAEASLSGPHTPLCGLPMVCDCLHGFVGAFARTRRCLTSSSVAPHRSHASNPLREPRMTRRTRMEAVFFAPFAAFRALRVKWFASMPKRESRKRTRRPRKETSGPVRWSAKSSSATSAASCSSNPFFRCSVPAWALHFGPLPSLNGSGSVFRYGFSASKRKSISAISSALSFSSDTMGFSGIDCLGPY